VEGREKGDKEIEVEERKLFESRLICFSQWTLKVTQNGTKR
jgi:hypothetical protein